MIPRFFGGGSFICIAEMPGTAKKGMEEGSMEEQEVSAVELEDGSYTVEVELEGGTGRASVTSPAELTVQDGEATARVEWSSSKYDYMVVGEEKYLPIQEEGNSTFEIPVLVFDEPMTVIADTTAMSVPHEVAYTLTFDSDSIVSGASEAREKAGIAVGVVLFVAVAAAVLWGRKRKRNGKK